jgi:hypothetical protein
MAYRSSVHESSRETPFTMFGSEMQIPLDLMIGTSNTANCETTTYVRDLRNRIESAYRDVRVNLKLAQKRQHRTMTEK